MSTTLVASNEQFTDIQNRLKAVEDELADLRRAKAAPSRDWRASMRRMLEGWASLPPEIQAEFTDAFETAEREARAIRVDDAE